MANLYDFYTDMGNDTFEEWYASLTKTPYTITRTDEFDKYAPVDIQVTGKTTSDVEIKTRPCEWNKRQVMNCYMEVEKYQNLMRYSDNKRKIYFIIYPFLNKIVYFDLTDVDPNDPKQMKKGVEDCNKRTSDQHIDKVPKEVYYLNWNADYAKCYNVDLSKQRDKIIEIEGQKEWFKNKEDGSLQYWNDERYRKLIDTIWKEKHQTKK